MLKRGFGPSVALGAAVLLVSHVGAAAEWTVTPTVTVGETYSDNIDLDPDGAETTAFVTEVTPAISIVGNSARAQAFVSAGLTARHQTQGDDDGTRFDVDLAGTATVEAVKELLFFDARASVSQQVLDTREANSSANESTVQTYEASPYLRGHFGDFADGEARYTFTQFLSNSSSASDSETHRVAFNLGSGRDFSRVLWTVDLSASKESRSDDDDIDRRDASLSLEYVFARYFSLLGSTGYQFFDDGNPSNEIEGIVWDAGFRWQPGPRTELRATYGRHDNNNSARVNFSYQFSTRTRLTASYAEVLDTSQGQIGQNLANIGVNQTTGTLINTTTGLAFDPRNSLSSIRDETTRTKTFRLNIDGSRGRNSFGAGFTIERQNVEPSGDDEDSIAVRANWSRQLNRRLNLDLQGSYENTKFSLDQREDHDYVFDGGLSYSLATNVNASLSYGYTRRDSNVAAEEYVENSVSINVSMQF